MLFKKSLACVAMMFVAGVGCQKETTAAPAPISAAPSQNVHNLPIPESGELAGELVLAPELAGKVQAGDTIFIMARNGATGGIIAVAKLAAADKFPMPFKLTGANVMMPGASLMGQVRLMARVDKDGDAMSKNPGDIVGEMPELVTIPASAVRLVLDKML